jgi:uncharacterized membrane protein
MAAKTYLKTLLTIFTVLFLLAQLTFGASPRYEIIDLGTLGGDFSIAYSINDNGQIVGLARNSADDLRATLFDKTGVGNNIDLGTLGSQRSEAYSINNMGQIVGSADRLATLFDPNGSGDNVELGTLSGDVQSVAYSVNNRGQIVGWSGYFHTWDHATLFDPNGSGNNIELGTLGGSKSAALSINDSGQIVGWAETECSTYPFCTVTYRATLFDESGNGENVSLGTLSGGWDHSRANSINNNGQIVGMVFNGSAYMISAAHAALFDPDGSNIDLGAIEGQNSYAHCINDKGQIVGSAGGRAALFDPSGDGNNIDLNTLIDPNSGWSLEEALSINEQGWIVGRGYYKPIGDTHAFLMMPVLPKIIYIDDDAAGANNGTSWEDAYNYLQDALSEARVAPTPVEIRVAQGIYKPDQGGSQTPSDREATFQLINGVTLKGGYAGAGTPDPNARNIELYETILSGDLDDNDVDVNDPSELLDEPTRAENSYHVVTGYQTESMSKTTEVLNGFTIIGGNANGSSYPNNRGGGMYCNSDATLTNCTFSGNSADWGGGGMYCGPTWCCVTYPTVTNCTFIGNSAGEEGGGMRVGDSDPKLTNCKISGNSAGSSGGGVMFGGDNFTIMNNCLISGNWAGEDGGGMFCIFTFNFHPSNCTITDNWAGRYGGGMYNEYGCDITPANCIFWGNRDSGGEDESAQIDYEPSQAPAVNYSCILGWTGDFGGTGNIGADPCFADVNNDDYHLKSQVGRWDANSQSWVLDDVTSPCIDAGNPGCAVGDEILPNGNRKNMGAYGGTAEASKSPPNWRSIADMTNDWVVDSNDLKVYVEYWLESGECIPADLDRSQFVDFDDFAIFGQQWSYPSAFGPGMTFQIDDCNMDAGISEEPCEPRFSVSVQGSYIHFEDLMYANCCPDKLGLEKEINGNHITLYEIGYGGLCDCMCYFPITATLGPFEDGIYTVQVIDNYGQSLGVVEVTIGQPTEPGIVYQIEDCNTEASGVFAAEPPDLARFNVIVEDLYIHFRDMMVANCCPDELGLEMTVEDNLITIYETEYTPGGCWCICDYHVTATLGPFEPGTYTLEVYEEWSGFIGSTTVVIPPPE